MLCQRVPFCEKDTSVSVFKMQGQVSPEPKHHAVSTDGSKDINPAFLISAMDGSCSFTVWPFCYQCYDMWCSFDGSLCPNIVPRRKPLSLLGI